MNVKSENKVDNSIHFDFNECPKTPIRILRFKKGSLYADFQDCVKNPGIYGTLTSPNELLDLLKVQNGYNIKEVRFASQFKLSQKELDVMLENGMKFRISHKLMIYFYSVN